MTFPAMYAILVGLLMMGQWMFLLATKQVPELTTEPIRIRFHLFDEVLTATALIVGGMTLLSSAAWAARIYPVASGMLIYTVIVSAGYFAQKRVWPIVGMFAVLLVLSLVSLVVFWQA